MKTDDTSTSSPPIPAQPDEFADALSLLIADAAWAQTRTGDARPAADVIAALDRWREHPLVSRAAALVIDTATFRSWELEPLYRALVRAARIAWLANSRRADLVEILGSRAEAEHADGSSSAAADLFATAVELCAELVVRDRAGALPLLAELLGNLVEVLSEAGTNGSAEHAELMARGAAAARWHIGVLKELIRVDRDRYLPSLAAAHIAAAGFVAWVDGSTAGIDQSRRGVCLYEELVESVGLSVVGRLDHVWSEHIAWLKSIGDASAARAWESRRIERLRRLAALAAETGSAIGLSSLIMVLRRRELYTEAAAVSERAVWLAEQAVDDEGEPALRRLAEELQRHGHCVHQAGQRAEAVRSWHRAIDVRRRISHAGNETAVVDGYREIVALAQRLGDPSVAIEFGDGAVGEWARLSELDTQRHLVALVDEMRAQADRLHKSGRSIAACEMAERAVTHAQNLASSDPDQYRQNLSWALTCATRMHLHARHAFADKRSQQAVELIEQLVHEDPDRHTAALANALHNRSIVLNQRNEYRQARGFLVRSAALYETMTKTKHQSSLANVLCTLSITLSHLRELDAALESAERAEAIYSRLAEKNPKTYLPDVAYAWNRLACVHEDMGNTDGVRSAATRVLEICESLADGPDRDRRRASALHVLVRNLSRTDRPTEALSYSTPLLELLERMAARDPAAEELELAIALGNHSMCLSDTGQPRPALEYAERALTLWRRLAVHGGYQERLASALDRYATALQETHQFERAIEVSAEAVEHYERLLADDRDLYLCRAAMCLNNHALRLDKVGRHEEAIATASRNLARFDELVALDRRANGRYLCGSLISHAIRLNALDRGTEAVDYAARAVALIDELMAEGADAAALDRARALHTYAKTLAADGRHDEAVSAQERAMRIVETEAVHDRLRCLLPLATVTHGLADRLVDAGQWQRAREHSRVAVLLWTELADNDSELYLHNLAQVLDEHGRRCADAKEWPEAADYAERAAAAFAVLTTRDALRHRPDWAWAVECHARARMRVREHRRASAEVDRALSIWREAVADAPENTPHLAAALGWAARMRLYNAEPELAPAHLELSVGLYTELIDGGRDDLVPVLLSVHWRYATSLWENGFREQAPTAMKDAVRLALLLVATDRAGHRSRLAEVLRDQSWLLAEAGHRHAAVGAGLAALSLVQQIIGESGDKRRWQLADYHDSLADCLADVGRVLEALEHNNRALSLWEELAAESGEPSTDLAWSLWHRARWLAMVQQDQHRIILAVSQRAVDIFEQAYRSRDDNNGFLPGALVDHARHLGRAGRHVEALAESSRALALWEAMAADNPRRDRPKLADCLRWHAAHLAQLSEHDAAIECARRALRLTEEAVEQTRLRYLPDLAALCQEIAQLLHDRDPDESRCLAQRSAALYAELAGAESVPIQSA